jgi:hypothetical protein
MIRLKRQAAAFVGAAAVIGSAGLVALAPTALAGTATMDATCQVPFLGEKKGPQEIKVDFQTTSGQAGTTVTANVDMGPPPITSPAAFPGAKAKVTLHLKMSGAATGTLDLVGPEVTVDIPANLPIDPAPFTTTFTVPDVTAAGDIKFVPSGSTNFTGVAGGQTAECTYAAQGSSDGVVATFAAEPGDPNAPTATLSPTEGPAGTEVTVTGTNWGADKTVQIVGYTAKGDHEASKDGAKEAQTDASGKFTAKYTVNDPETVGIGIARKDEPTTFKELPFTVKTGGGDPTDPPGGEEPMEPKLVNVTYKCETPGQGTADSVRDIMITVPKTGAKDATVDVKANFKDDILGQFPDSLPVENITVNITPKLTVKISDGKQWNGTTDVVGAGFDVVLKKGATMKGGPLNGTWKIPGGGMFSFTPDVLVMDVKLNGATAATTTCTPTKAVEVSAQLKATGDTPPPTGGGTQGNTGGTTGTTGSSGTTGSTGTSGDSGGDLAKTGTGGSTVNAFALVAGTAVLAAVGVMLLIPYRRRARARG